MSGYSGVSVLSLTRSVSPTTAETPFSTSSTIVRSYNLLYPSAITPVAANVEVTEANETAIAAIVPKNFDFFLAFCIFTIISILLLNVIGSVPIEENRPC